MLKSYIQMCIHAIENIPSNGNILVEYLSDKVIISLLTVASIQSIFSNIGNVINFNFKHDSEPKK